MEKEEVRNVALFGDILLAIVMCILTIVDYIKYTTYTSEGILTPVFWILYLITFISLVLTVLSISYNKYIMPAVSISSIFIFLSSIVSGFIISETYDKPLLLWLFPLLSLIYIVFRGYAYSK